jgi:glutaconate CoA-transferase, subunit A
MSINLIGLAEAAAMVKDGDEVAVTGSMDMTPMAFVRQLARRGARDLRFVAVPIGGIGCDLLVGAGALVSAEFAQVSFGEYGLAPNFRRRVQEGRLKTLDHT